MLIYSFLTIGLPHPQRGDIPYLLVIGLLNTGLAYLLYFSGLQKRPGQSVALISYVDPVSALVFSALLLHESMSTLQTVGAVLIIGGAILGELKKTGREYRASFLSREASLLPVFLLTNTVFRCIVY